MALIILTKNNFGFYFKCHFLLLKIKNMNVKQLMLNLSNIKDQSLEIITDEEYINMMFRLINNITEDRDYYKEQYNDAIKE